MERNITTIKYFVIILSTFMFAFLLQYFVIYKHLIVPHLSGIKSVPMLWWAGYMLPVVIVSVLAGFWSRGIKEIIITSLLVSVIYNLFVFFLAKFHEPGFLKAYEGSFISNFIKGFLVFIFVYFILLFIGYAGNRLMSAPRKNKCG